MFDVEKITGKKFYYNELYYDFIFNFNKISHGYFYDYSTADTYKKRVEDINSTYDPTIRKRVGAVLKKNNVRYGCGASTLENLEALTDGSAMVVIGGQQPGFLTGPIFIIYKIISVIRLSIFLSGLLKFKVVPVFWNASDDSNFAQVSEASFINKKIERVLVSGPETGFNGAGKRFSDIPINKDIIAENIRKLLEILPLTDFRQDIINFFAECVRSIKENFKGSKPGFISLPDLFSVIVQRIFSEYGLIILDPSDENIRKLAVELAIYDIEKSAFIQKAILHSGDILKKAGYHSQLSPEKDVLDFFFVKNGVRKKIRRINDGVFEFSDQKIRKDELVRIVEKNPSKISLNVALRPLFQDMILPVICTVCGPGEVSYFAQLKEVYDLRKEKSAVIYPRFSATVIENKVSKSLKRAGIVYGDLQSVKTEITGRYLKKFLNFDIEKLLKDFENDIFLKINGLKNLIEESGLESGTAFNRIRDNIGREISVLNKKLISELKEKNSRFVEDIDRIYLNIFPDSQLQERTVNIFNYINKYGFCFIKHLFNLSEDMSNFHRFIFTGKTTVAE
ncbi:MAG: bacillithiol biosynthesis cysteine-adding enzyme BshC [Actinobacteria bacterium]|nr:bacillithiol biosynthesis cysteine-adding enzyme BshC [Actinomycetota bacterium]